MPLDFAMSLMSVLEFLLWATLGFLFWKKGLHSASPHECISSSAGWLDAHSAWVSSIFRPSLGDTSTFPFYFYPYWAVYIASAITLFFVTIEIFRSVLSSFSGLMRLGTVVFRWVALVSAVASLGSVSFSHLSVMIIPDIAFALMRSVSILELCLLAFLLPLHECAPAFFERYCLRLRPRFGSYVSERFHSFGDRSRKWFAHFAAAVCL